MVTVFAYECQQQQQESNQHEEQEKGQKQQNKQERFAKDETGTPTSGSKSSVGPRKLPASREQNRQDDPDAKVSLKSSGT